MALSILHSMNCIVSDPDTTLFPSLIEGVSTGFFHDIPLSNCFPLTDRAMDNDAPLSAQFGNWQSADNDIALTKQLVQKEIDQGWVFEFPGDISAAQQKYPAGIALGRLGIAISEGRDLRLVVDSSICGLNAGCHIPERSTPPSAKDVCRCYPLRGGSTDLMGFSLDVKAAHKRIVLKESEQGLVGFTFQNKIYLYRVCPFGAVFSAAWWSRLGGFLLRMMRNSIWIPHAAWLYVDDFLFIQRKDMMPLTAALLCIFAQITHLPISWKKTELSTSLTWIGWRFHFLQAILRSPQTSWTRSWISAGSQ